MSRKLEEATEEILQSPRGAKTISEAGFSEELKQRLLADKPWTGEESMPAAVSRMLNDAHKPLPIDLRRRRPPRLTAGQKIATARESAQQYAEKTEYQKELQERFTPSARPATMVGLAALANERIEDAIARGQFKDIPRGPGVLRDDRADNPFIDTTEYIMNKMIQRQDLVPPWIDKQQELVRQANVFRARLRNDWKRHAARSLASRATTLEERLELAQQNLASERAHNPKLTAVDQIAVPTTITDDPVMSGRRDVAEKPALPLPFRDPAWEQAEASYLTLAIANLNTLTRSYNLMAPDLAKKPYFALEREMRACYADVAPLLADAMKADVSLKTRSGVSLGSGILDQIGGKKVYVHDETRPGYGLRELWRDFWKSSA